MSKRFLENWETLTNVFPEWEIHKYSGGYSEGATPVPISNTAVKSFSADGTAWETVWESRTLPDTQ